MAQRTSRPQNPPTDVADRVVVFPIREAPCVADGIPTLPSGHPATARKLRARTRVIRQVAVLAVAGRLGDVVEDLDEAVEQALAEGPRGVVCDLSAVFEGAEQDAVEVLATAGRHVRDWPGTPVVVVCRDPRVRKTLAAHPLGGHLVVSPSLFTAICDVLATPALAVERLQLTPHPTSRRASRDFVTRTLLDWRLGRVIPAASQVVSELVANSAAHAGTDMDLSIAWNLGALRIAVRDHGPQQPDRPAYAPDLQARDLSRAAGLPCTSGFLPAADGGQAVWAVLEAPRPRTATRGTRPGRLTESQNSPGFVDGRGFVELPFCALPRRRAAVALGEGADRNQGETRPS